MNILQNVTLFTNCPKFRKKYNRFMMQPCISTSFEQIARNTNIILNSSALNQRILWFDVMCSKQDILYLDNIHNVLINSYKPCWAVI